jgi:exopolysaccharide production protein ExoZ
VRFYGRISYSFYLLHMIGVAVAVNMIGDLRWPNLLLVIASFALSIAIATPLAWVFWKFIEMPFISLGKKTRPARDVRAFGPDAKSVGASGS